MKTAIKLFVGAIMLTSLYACNENSDTASNDPNNPSGFNLASFASWPTITGDADPEQAGQNNLVFVTDRSGSMDDPACGSEAVSKSNVVAKTISGFIPNIPSDVAVGYIDFGNENVVQVPLGKNNRDALTNAASSHRPDMGGTYVGHAIERAYDMLADAAVAQGGVGTFRMVLIVDGGASDLGKLETILGKIENTPIEVLTAGFCIGSGHMLNQPNDMVYVEANDASGLEAVMTAAVKMEAPAVTGDFVGADPEETQ